MAANNCAVLSAAALTTCTERYDMARTYDFRARLRCRLSGPGMSSRSLIPITRCHRSAGSERQAKWHPSRSNENHGAASEKWPPPAVIVRYYSRYYYYCYYYCYCCRYSG